MNRERNTWFKGVLGLTVCILCAMLPCVGGCGKDSDRVPLYNKWEITERTPLLNIDGTLAAWGWARHALMDYNRESIQDSRKERLKEWDFYSISSPEYYFELTLANINWLMLMGASFVNFETGEASASIYFDGQTDQLTMPLHPYEGIGFESSERTLSFTCSEDTRTLSFSFPEAGVLGPGMHGEILVQDDPEEESLATAVPFHQPDLFFYTDKIVALPASGSIEVDGRIYSFDADGSHAVLDWGRGVWPDEFEWTWAVAAGMVDGKRLGFNIGFGDEDMSRTTGNSVVVDGVLHKLGKIDWSYTEDGIMQPWYFRSQDDRFDMVLEPFYDQSNEIDLGAYYMKAIKVHGRVGGYVVLDDGTSVEIEDFIGFAEHAFQRW